MSNPDRDFYNHNPQDCKGYLQNIVNVQLILRFQSMEHIRNYQEQKESWKSFLVFRIITKSDTYSCIIILCN